MRAIEGVRTGVFMVECEGKKKIYPYLALFPFLTWAQLFKALLLNKLVKRSTH